MKTELKMFTFIVISLVIIAVSANIIGENITGNVVLITGNSISDIPFLSAIVNVVSNLFSEKTGMASTLADGENTFYVSPIGIGSHNGSTGNEMNLSDAINYANLHTSDELKFLMRDGSYGEFAPTTWNERTKWVTWKAVNKLKANFKSIRLGDYNGPDKFR